VLGRRAALAALDEPALPGKIESARVSEPATNPAQAPTIPVERETLEALWEHAGIERSAEGLASLLEDAHPLARLIARSAMQREESRGTHTRTDRPDRDARLDGRHLVSADAESALRWEQWS
jgi:L-aspartate oxidase